METRSRLKAIELLILVGLANGKQSKEIAARAGLSKATVELYVQRLRAQYSALSRAHLVACALRDGAITASDVEDPGGSARR